jgi:hypothetical protein
MPFVNVKITRDGVRGVRVIVVLAAVVTGILLGLASFLETYGVGHFSQDVVVETDKPILRVAYASSSLDEQTRAASRTTPHGVLPHRRRPAAGAIGFRPASNSRHDRWYRSQVFYQPHLVVYVEFEDGTLQCRVADIPAGRGKTPVVVRLQ